MKLENPSREELLQEIRHLRGRLERLEGRGGAMRSIVGLSAKVIQLDEEDHVEYVNRALAEMAGVDRHDVIGKHVSVIDRFSWGEGLLTKLIAASRTQGMEVTEDIASLEGAGPRRHHRITASITAGKAQILIEDLTAVKVLESTFKRYVSPAVIQRMIAAQGEKDFFKAERYEMTVLFCDLRGFTAMSEGMRPEEVRTMVNEYLTAMTEVIVRHEGTLDKFVGDEVMAIFGAPIYHGDHALRALRVGLDMQEAHRRTQAKWRAQGRPAPGVGIGINTGEMVVGNMGSPMQVNYSVLGHAVNLAARLCSLARPGEVLLGERNFAVVKEAATAEMLSRGRPLRFEHRGSIEAKGISRPVEIISVGPDRAQTMFAGSMLS